MANRNFHIIILGESLANRVAGILLAKKGLRVLTFTAPRPTVPPWLMLSGSMEQFLEHLGGRSCLTPAVPLQVVTPKTRTEINGSLSITDELKREFPEGHAALQSLLERFADLGERLEDALRDSKILPIHGIKSRVGFLRATLPRKLTRKVLHRPFLDTLSELPEPLSREFLQALMEGLSLTPAGELTQGEAALLWRSAIRPRSISVSAFEALLRQRYEQFHGETECGAQIESLQMKGSRVEGVLLKDGRRCTGEYFLLGSADRSFALPPEMAPQTATSGTFVTDLSARSVSPLLAPRILLSGDPLLHLTLTPSGDDTLTCVSQTLAGVISPDSQRIAERLQTLFPFAGRITPAVVENGAALPTRNRYGSGTFPGISVKVGMKKNLLRCCAQTVLPSLGATGEILLGQSCARQILRWKKL